MPTKVIFNCHTQFGKRRKREANRLNTVLKVRQLVSELGYCPFIPLSIHSFIEQILTKCYEVLVLDFATLEWNDSLGKHNQFCCLDKRKASKGKKPIRRDYWLIDSKSKQGRKRERGGT